MDTRRFSVVKHFDTLAVIQAHRLASLVSWLGSYVGLLSWALIDKLSFNNFFSYLANFIYIILNTPMPKDWLSLFGFYWLWSWGSFPCLSEKFWGTWISLRKTGRMSLNCIPDSRGVCLTVTYCASLEKLWPEIFYRYLLDCLVVSTVGKCRGT